MKPFLNQRLTEQLKQADRVFLCTHISPDGDAIGSLLALRLLLTGMGKAVTACCPDPVPKALRPLPGATDVVTPDQVSGPFDAALSVDGADRGRIGSSIAIYDGAPVRLCARPEELIVQPKGLPGLKAVVDDCVFLGLNTHYFVHLLTGEKAEIIQESTIDSVIPQGTEISLRLNTDKANLFEKESQLSLMSGVQNDLDALR